jgi:hypothetical protein
MGINPYFKRSRNKTPRTIERRSFFTQTVTCAEVILTERKAGIDAVRDKLRNAPFSAPLGPMKDP